MKIPTVMEIIIIIILLGSIVVSAAIKRYNRKKGELIPTGNSTLNSKAKKIIAIVGISILDILLVFLAPFLLIFDVYHIWLGWASLSFFLSAGWLLICQITGCFLYVLGYIIYALGRVQLGGYYADMWAPAKLGEGFTQTGIFSRVRHPLYSGGLIFEVGLILIFQIWVGLVLFLPVTIIMVQQAYAEEAWLIEKYGSDYENYMHRTGRFFPKLRW